MSSAEDTRSSVRTAFAARDAAVDRAFREDATFRSLCRDYCQCAAALEWWGKSDEATASARAREYADLLGELTTEINGWLDDLEARVRRSAPAGSGEGRELSIDARSTQCGSKCNTQ